MSLRIEQDGHLLTKPGPQLLPLKMSFSPPSTWEKMFQELMQEEKPRAKWTFQLDKNILPNVMAVGWRQYQQTGLGRFQCSICNRWWISAQVKILCHMYREPGKSQGRVLMRIFGQRCQKCSKSQFENPEFFTESIGRIMENLINYILQKYYGHGSKKKPSTSNEKPLKVPLDRPHDTANCEACTLGYHGGCSFAYEANLPKYPSSQPNSHSSSTPKSHSSPPPKTHSSSPPMSYSSCLKMSLSSSPPMNLSSSPSKIHSSSPPKSHSSSPPKSHSSSPPKSHSSSPPMSYSSCLKMSLSSSPPMNLSSSPPKSYSSSPPKSHNSTPPKSHNSSPPKSYSSSPPKSHSSSLPKSHSSFPPKSHSFSPPKSHSSFPPKSHSSSPPKSHSSSPPKSHSSLPQTRNMYVENRHFEEHRETNYTELLIGFSLAALTFIRQFFK